MGYVNPNWRNNNSPYISAENLNAISSTLECVPVDNGGTGADNAADARANLGLGGAAIESLGAGNPLGLANGGTGATDAPSVRATLGLSFWNLMKFYDSTDLYADGATITLESITGSVYIYFVSGNTYSFTDKPSDMSETNFHFIQFSSPLGTRTEEGTQENRRKIQFLIPETRRSLYMRKIHGGSTNGWSIVRFTEV